MITNLMVIFERYLKSDGYHLRIGGVVTRDVAHFKGVPHGTVLIAIIILKCLNNEPVPHILLHWRDKWKKTCPETWDICGGHVEANEKLMSDRNLWDDDIYIKNLFRITALRESNEEFCIPSKPEFEFKENTLKCFGGFGAFESGFDDPASTNKEYSTLYIAFVPKESLSIENNDMIGEKLRIEDSIGIGGKVQETKATKMKLITLPELVLEFSKNPSEYADGVSRILNRLKDEPGTLYELNKFLEFFYKQ